MGNFDPWRRRDGSPTIARTNRVKTAVLALFGLYWASVVVILVVARSTFDQVGGLHGDQRLAEIAAVLVLTALLMLLSVGVVRSWRWTFWLIQIVFLAGILRVPVAVLELDGRVSSQGPTWFVVFTAVVGLTQFCIGVAMLTVHRKSALWGQLWVGKREGGSRGASET